jgi:hypothetical protein
MITDYKRKAELFRRLMKSRSDKLKSHPKNLQNVHTPFSLCYNIIGKLKEYTSLEDKTFLCLNMEWIEILIANYGVKPENIWFVTDCKEKGRFFAGCGFSRYNGVKVVNKDLRDWETKMKFDFVIGNPPYQGKSRGESMGAGHTLWDKFVEKALALVKDGGYISMIHPAGWRRPTGNMRATGDLLRKKQIEYLELHNFQDGQKTFNVCSRYDWYVLHNVSAHKPTSIIDEDGNNNSIDISLIPCIPNGMMDKIIPLLATNKDEEISLLRSQSAYETRRDWMSEEESENNKFPCIYSLPLKGIQIKWSSINTSGHFGVPKVIFSNGAASQIIVDKDGKYGLTQFAFSIVDTPENLPKIKQAMESPEFIELCKSMRFTLDRYDVGFISCLKKDFWKEFV